MVGLTLDLPHFQILLRKDPRAAFMKSTNWTQLYYLKIHNGSLLAQDNLTPRLRPSYFLSFSFKTFLSSPSVFWDHLLSLLLFFSLCVPHFLCICKHFSCLIFSQAGNSNSMCCFPSHLLIRSSAVFFSETSSHLKILSLSFWTLMICSFSLFHQI